MIDCDKPRESDDVIKARENLRDTMHKLSKQGREHSAFVVSLALQILDRATEPEPAR